MIFHRTHSTLELTVLDEYRLSGDPLQIVTSVITLRWSVGQPCTATWPIKNMLSFTDFD